MSKIADEISEIYQSGGDTATVHLASQVPPSYASMTTDWLTDVLCTQVPNAQVTSFDFDVRDDGSSNRRRIFLAYNRAGEEADLPKTVFCKATDTLINRILLGASGAGKAEVDFYTKARSRLDMEAPRAWYAGYDPSNYASVIMLHDMREDVAFCNEETYIDRSRAESQVRNIARLHARFHDSPELGTSTLPFIQWPIWWARVMEAMPQYEEYCDLAFAECEEIMAPRLFRRRAEIWSCTEKSVARHNVLPRTLIHGDVHLKNWYVKGNGQMGLSDWQTITIGHWSRDLIYMITTALTVEDRRKWESDLILLYLDQLAEHGGPRVTFDEAMLDIRQQLFTALAFWTNTLRPAPGMPDMQPRGITILLLRRLLAAVDDHDSCDSFD